MKPHLQCAEQQVSRSNLTKYCACHAERLTYLIIITYETSFTMRGATAVTIQPHQILRLSHRKTHILSPRHIWTLNKHNHCSPQRHTILLLHFLLSSWPQSAKTYDLKKHLLSDLLHLTNTTIAVRKDIQYCFYIFSCLRGRSPQRHTTWRNIYSHISYT